MSKSYTSSVPLHLHRCVVGLLYLLCILIVSNSTTWIISTFHLLLKFLIRFCLLIGWHHQGSLMMEAVRTSETSVDNHFTRQYIPEDNSEHYTCRRENLKSHIVPYKKFYYTVKVYRQWCFSWKNHVYGLCPSSSVFPKTQCFGNWICFHLHLKRRWPLLCWVPLKELALITTPVTGADPVFETLC
jgi:hypothetical protein